MVFYRVVFRFAPETFPATRECGTQPGFGWPLTHPPSPDLTETPWQERVAFRTRVLRELGHTGANVLNDQLLLSCDPLGCTFLGWVRTRAETEVWCELVRCETSSCPTFAPCQPTRSHGKIRCSGRFPACFVQLLPRRQNHLATSF